MRTNTFLFGVMLLVAFTLALITAQVPQAYAATVLFNTDGFSINEYNAATGAFQGNVPLGAVALGARYAFGIGPKGNFYIASDSTAGSTLFTYDAAGNLIGSTAIPLFNVADSSTFPQAITVDATDKLLFVATGSHVVAFSLVDGVPNGVKYTLGGFGQVALAHGRNLKK